MRRLSPDTTTTYLRDVIPVHRSLSEPTTSLEEVQYRCTVLELLDPTKDIWDDFDGIYCKTRKGNTKWTCR